MHVPLHPHAKFRRRKLMFIIKVANPLIYVHFPYLYTKLFITDPDIDVLEVFNI